MIFRKIKKLWQSLVLYIIADPQDNSITLSKSLFRHIKANAKGDSAQVFVFRVGGSNTYGFTLNPDIEQPTQMCDIQYNEKYKCIGFETLCPSVGAILYNYNLSADKRVKLSVSIQKSGTGDIYYQIDRPND